MFTERVVIKFVKTHPDAQLPSKNYSDDNCFDVYAVEDTGVLAQGSAVVPVGLTVAHITPGYGFVVRPRSGLGFKAGIQPHLGEIDNAYRGDVGVKLYNFSNTDYIVRKGDRIAQFKVERVYPTDIEWADEIVPSNRGEKGFGSSGK